MLARSAIAIGALVLTPHAALADQNPLDRADPTIIEDQEDERELERAAPSRVELPATPSADAAATTPLEPIDVGAIRIEGSSLPTAAFLPVIRKYVGRSLSPDDLRSLSSEIQDIVQERGYVLSSVFIPPQRVAKGILTVSVSDGALSGIELLGADNAAVRRVLAPLANGKPVTVAELERRLLIAEDLPGIRLGDPTFTRSGEQSILRVPVREDRLAASVRLDNDGSDTVGPWRSRFGVRYRGAAVAGDELRAAFVTTPFEPGDLLLGSLRYEAPVGSAGTTMRFGGYYAASEPDSILANNDRDGDGFGVSVGVEHPLLRSRDGSLWVEAEAGYRRSVQDRDGARIRRDVTTTVEVSLNGAARFMGGFARARTALIQGLDLLGATDDGERLSSRADGSGTFTAAEFDFYYARELADRFDLRLAGTGQIASRPLLAGNEFGVGGPRFGRGFDFYERSGEDGIAGSVELAFDLGDIGTNGDLVDDIELYAFADAATVSNQGGGFGGGELYSAGGGIRARLADKLRLGLEAGVPLNTDRFDSGDRSPRLRLSARAYF